MAPAIGHRGMREGEGVGLVGAPMWDFRPTENVTEGSVRLVLDARALRNSVHRNDILPRYR